MRRELKVDFSEIDTLVVPTREDGFHFVYLGEQRWYQVRLPSDIIPKIQYVAAYRIAPTSAIKHVAPVQSIEPWYKTDRNVLNFAEPARELDHPIRRVPEGKVRAIQGPRYACYDRLIKARTLELDFIH
jgi:hypothetical protein